MTKKAGWLQYLRKDLSYFHQNYTMNVSGPGTYLIGQKIKGQGHSKQRPENRGEYNTFINIELISKKLGDVCTRA